MSTIDLKTAYLLKYITDVVPGGRVVWGEGGVRDPLTRVQGGAGITKEVNRKSDQLCIRARLCLSFFPASCDSFPIKRVLNTIGKFVVTK